LTYYLFKRLFIDKKSKSKSRCVFMINHRKSTNSPRRTRHVLLVEDNLVALRVIELFANQIGLQTLSATTGEQAMELATTHDFDLIITDLGLPGISGYLLSANIREWEQLNNRPSTPIIGITAKPLQEVSEQCKLSGMNWVLSKPINGDILTKMVGKFT
jgi:two-component system aerobic respiration control sensor histidine kinase ArcB